MYFPPIVARDRNAGFPLFCLENSEDPAWFGRKRVCTQVGQNRFNSVVTIYCDLGYVLYSCSLIISKLRMRKVSVLQG